MAVSFVALLPISVIFAATRDRLWGPRIWFQTHRALNVFTSLLLSSLLGGLAIQSPRLSCLQYAHTSGSRLCNQLTAAGSKGIIVADIRTPLEGQGLGVCLFPV